MISIILINWNGWADTTECVQSLENTHPAPARVIIVDNKSTDDSIKRLELWARGELDLALEETLPSNFACMRTKMARQISMVDVESNTGAFSIEEADVFPSSSLPIYLVRSPKNGGFGYGCNLGIRLGLALGSDGFWLLNNDCVVTPNTLAEISNYLAIHPKTIFGTEIRYYFRPEQVQVLGGGHLSRWGVSLQPHTDRNQRKRILNYINGASLIFSTEAILELGYFDEKIFMYFEEIDICLRASALNYNFQMIPVVVYHKHGGSQGGCPSEWAWTQVLLNKPYVLHKNLGLGPWFFIYIGMLLVRSISPFRPSAEQQAARAVLKGYIKGFFLQ